jgi:hypothetical protein
MSVKRHWRANLAFIGFSCLLIILGFGASAPVQAGSRGAAQATITPTSAPQTTSTPSATATQTGELSVQPEDELVLEQFSPLAPFKLRFSLEMNPTSAELPLLPSPYIEGALTWEENHRVLVFTPTAGFAPGQTYTFYLDTASKAVLEKA